MTDLHRDDSEISRFQREGLLRFRARDGVIAVAIAAVVLVFLAGGSVRDAADQMNPGIGRDILLAIGKPTGWVADQLPFAEAASDVTAGLSPDADLDGGGGFVAGTEDSSARVPGVTPDYFDPQALGEPQPAPQPLETLLVTGDSLSTPLDLELSRRYSELGVEVIRDPHLATGISKSDLLDWGELATSQIERYAPDAVVVFIGANEGFPIPGPGGDIQCCGADWAAAYANRVRQMMNTYRQDGSARVYWLTVPTPRDDDLAEIARVVNAGIDVAAQPYRAQVEVLDTVSIFTPGDEYRDSMEIDGEQTIVRESDGIHLNDAGLALEADQVEAAIDEDFAPQAG